MESELKRRSSIPLMNSRDLIKGIHTRNTQLALQTGIRVTYVIGGRIYTVVPEVKKLDSNYPNKV